MLGQDVIDLLSTDDEAPAQISDRRKDSFTGRFQARSINDDFTCLSDDLDSDVNFRGWEDKPAKRQRLTPPPAISQRSHVSDNASPRKASFGAVPAAIQKNQWVDLSDPVIFTSSPHRNDTAGPSRNLLQQASRLSDESDDDFPDDPRLATSKQLASISQVSDRTAALLASLKAPTQKKTSNGHKKSEDKPELKATLPSLKFEDDEDGAETVCSNGNKSAVSKTSKRTRLTDAEREAKLREKEAKDSEKLRKAKEKEDEKEKKRLAKEEKAKEKQVAADLAEVNRSRTDKKMTTSEMIVDLPASIGGQSVDTQIREILKNLGADINLYQSPIPNVIKWRRKADRVYNHEKGHWDPLHRIEIQEEKHIMCLMPAKEFVALATAASADLGGRDLEAHVLELKSKFQASTPIYLIEGLNAWMRKNKTIRNRVYQTAVLTQDAQSNGSGTTEKQASRRKKPVDQYIDEDMIEDALLRLQVIYNCLIHHTAASVESAEWVANFTQHISTIPYKYFLLHFYDARRI